MKKKLLWIGLAVLAALALAWVLRPAPVLAETALITRGPFDRTVDEQAKTRVRDHYVVSTPLAGRIERIALVEGDVVRSGETLAVLHPVEPSLIDARTRGELENRVEAAKALKERAQANVIAAEVALTQARTDFERSTKLAAQHLVPAAQLDADRLLVELKIQELEAARAGVNAAGHEIDIAKAALSRASGRDLGGAAWFIRAPVEGRIVRILQTSEATLDVGTPLVEIADSRNLEVVAEVLTTEAAELRPGARVELTNWGGPFGPRGAFEAHRTAAFTKISALGVEEQRVNVLIDIVSPPSQRPALGEGYRVDVRVAAFHSDSVLRVPTGALFKSGDRWSVYRVSADGRARRTDVEIGQRNATDAELLRGLAQNDRVVVYPSDAIEDGTRIASDKR